MQRLILGAITLLAWIPLAGQPQREDAAIQARIDETSARGGGTVSQIPWGQLPWYESINWESRRPGGGTEIEKGVGAWNVDTI